MRFTVLSHAGLAVDHQSVRLVCDPWLIGSCYWRSWWNFPEPTPELVFNLAPQFIYLTHLHWDHFHGPSLKKLFDPNTKIIVPKVPTSRMLDDLRWLGFHNLVEVPHGGRLNLGDDFQLRSYQFGVGVDSAVVISGGGRVLFNCNDAKLFGLPLRQVLRDHPKIDFIFRSHSSASPVPLCIEDHERLLAHRDGSYDSADQFARCAIQTGARYAIPFASNHCFLHPETRRFNATVTTPELARQRYAALAAEACVDTECVVMPPGSSWSDADGFDIAHFDFSRRDAYVESMIDKNSAKLNAQVELESQATADFAAFETYFHGFGKSLPRFVRRRLPAITFRVTDSVGKHLWLINLQQGAVTEVPEIPPGVIVIEVHAVVLNDCAKLRMFSVWTASKRLRIRLPCASSLAHVNLLFTLLDMYETDLLPLTKNFTARSVAVRLRRWREPAELVRILLRRIFLRQRFSVDRVYPMKSGVQPDPRHT